MTSAREELALEFIPVRVAQLLVIAEGDRAACLDLPWNNLDHALRGTNHVISSIPWEARTGKFGAGPEPQQPSWAPADRRSRAPSSYQTGARLGRRVDCGRDPRPPCRRSCRSGSRHPCRSSQDAPAGRTSGACFESGEDTNQIRPFEVYVRVAEVCARLVILLENIWRLDDSGLQPINGDPCGLVLAVDFLDVLVPVKTTVRHGR